jgi:hypothetical protein
VIKSKTRQAGHVPCMDKMRYAIKFWSENLKGRDNSADLRIEWKIISEWILWK